MKNNKTLETLQVVIRNRKILGERNGNNKRSCQYLGLSITFSSRIISEKSLKLCSVVRCKMNMNVMVIMEAYVESMNGKFRC